MGVINLETIVQKILNRIGGSGYLTPTDYATSSTGGTVKVDTDYGIEMTAAGKLRGTVETATDYGTAGNNMLVSKGTLNNVLAAQPSTAKLDLLFSGNLSAGAASYALAHDYTDYDLLLCNQTSASDYATGGWVTAVATLVTGSGKYNNLGANAKIGFDPSDPDAFTTSSDTGATTGYMIYGIKL